VEGRTVEQDEHGEHSADKYLRSRVERHNCVHPRTVARQWNPLTPRTKFRLVAGRGEHRQFSGAFPCSAHLTSRHERRILIPTAFGAEGYRNLPHSESTSLNVGLVAFRPRRANIGSGEIRDVTEY
jgi:hypothetical protein